MVKNQRKQDMREDILRMAGIKNSHKILVLLGKSEGNKTTLQTQAQERRVTS